MRKASTRYSLLGRTLEVATNDPWCSELLSSAYDVLHTPVKGFVDHTASLMRESCGQLHLRYDTRELPYPNPYEEEPFRAASAAVDTLFARFAVDAPGHLALRATSVASPDGAVIIIGPRGIGTSMLALHLVHLGAEFLGDDIVLADLSARTITALPRRPSLREGALRFVPTRELRDTIAAAPHVYRTKRGRYWYALRGADLAGIKPSTSARRICAVVTIGRRNAEKPCVSRMYPDDALCALLNYGLTGWQTLAHIAALRRTLEEVACFSISVAGPSESARLLTKALIASA